MVNRVRLNPLTSQFRPIDCRIFNPEQDGKTKIGHVSDMPRRPSPRQIGYQTVLTDSRYALTDLSKWLIAEGKTFHCPVKSNRKVDGPGGEEPCQPVCHLGFSSQGVIGGKPARAHRMPGHTCFKLSRVLVSARRTDYASPMI